MPTWEQVAAVDRLRHREGRQGRGPDADAVADMQSQADVDRHRALTMAATDDATHAPTATRSARRDAAARRPHAAAAGCRRVGPRAAVHGAVPGVHRRPGAGQPRDELHRHAQHRHAHARSRSGSSGWRTTPSCWPTRCSARSASTPLLYVVLGRAADDGAGARRGGRAQPDHAAPRLLPGRLLPAGRDQHRRGLGGLEVPAARRGRAGQRRARLGRHRRARPGWTAPRWRCRRWS